MDLIWTSLLAVGGAVLLLSDITPLCKAVGGFELVIGLILTWLVSREMKQ